MELIVRMKRNIALQVEVAVEVAVVVDVEVAVRAVESCRVKLKLHLCSPMKK